MQNGFQLELDKKQNPYTDKNGIRKIDLSEEQMERIYREVYFKYTIKDVYKYLEDFDLISELDLNYDDVCTIAEFILNNLDCSIPYWDNIRIATMNVTGHDNLPCY